MICIHMCVYICICSPASGRGRERRARPALVSEKHNSNMCLPHMCIIICPYHPTATSSEIYKKELYYRIPQLS